MWAGGFYGSLADYLGLWALWASLTILTFCFFRWFPRSTRRRRFLLIGNGLVALMLAGAAALLAESYLRFVSTATDAYGATLTCKRWHVAYAPTNSLGCRDPEWTEYKPEGVKRLAVIGDSFTYGWGINRVEDRFSDLLQAKFDGWRPGAVEVMNVAWRGWDTRAQVDAVERILREYGVDEVLLAYVPNDIEKVLPTGPDFNPHRPPVSRWVRTEASFLLDYLYYRLYAPWTAGASGYCDWLSDGFEQEQTWHAHETDLGRMIVRCRDRGAMLRAALLPFLKTSGTKFDSEAIHAKLTRFFQINQTPVVDLLPVVCGIPPHQLAVNAHDYHPNERANRLMAEGIWNAFGPEWRGE